MKTNNPDIPSSTASVQERFFRLPLSSIGYLGKSALTLFITPPHKMLHKDIESLAIDHELYQPSQAPIDETRQAVYSTLEHAGIVQVDNRLSKSQLIHLCGILIQFTNHVGDTDLSYDYDKIAALKDRFAKHAEAFGPLAFDSQLAISLEETDNDLIESLWLLFITSRHYARWLDSAIIPEHNQSDDTRLSEMMMWRQAIAACKNPEPGQPQDPAGDNYYAWTHALAKVIISTHPQGSTLAGQLASQVFENGTTIMHSLVHFCNKQAVPNSHSVAADYGNVIGESINQFLDDR